jgi:nucleotide-binding universal stress UspA family protein
VALLHVSAGSDLDAATADASKALSSAGIDGTPLATTLQENESVSRAIVRVAGEQGAAMLAMDTRGHGALHHALHGSTALEVLAHTELPVLLTGAGLADTPVANPYHVLICTDGSFASHEVMRALAPLLTPGRFKVTLLQVHERDPDAAAETAEVAEIDVQLNSLGALFGDGLDIQTRVREIARLGGVDTAIIEEARHLGASAIALSSHGTTARRHLFAGSTALQLLGRSPLPMLMARGAE